MVGCVKKASIKLFSATSPTALYLFHLLRQCLSLCTQAYWIPEKTTICFCLEWKCSQNNSHSQTECSLTES